MPCGIWSAPEHFQIRMNAVLSGLDGVLCLMDDVLVFRQDEDEHHRRLTMALEKIQSAGVAVWEETIEISWHIINENGI